MGMRFLKVSKKVVCMTSISSFKPFEICVRNILKLKELHILPFLMSISKCVTLLLVNWFDSDS